MPGLALLYAGTVRKNVAGMGLLWVGFGLTGGAALSANPRAVIGIVSAHLAPSAGALTSIAIDWVRGPRCRARCQRQWPGLGSLPPPVACCRGTAS